MPSRAGTPCIDASCCALPHPLLIPYQFTETVTSIIYHEEPQSLGAREISTAKPSLPDPQGRGWRFSLGIILALYLLKGLNLSFKLWDYSLNVVDYWQVSSTTHSSHACMKRTCNEGTHMH